jgi:hypothetical protein
MPGDVTEDLTLYLKATAVEYLIAFVMPVNTGIQ